MKKISLFFVVLFIFSCAGKQSYTDLINQLSVKGITCTEIIVEKESVCAMLEVNTDTASHMQLFTETMKVVSEYFKNEKAVPSKYFMIIADVKGTSNNWLVSSPPDQPLSLKIANRP